MAGTTGPLKPHLGWQHGSRARSLPTTLRRVVQQAHAGDEGGTVEVAGDPHETGAPVGGRPRRQAQRRREDMLQGLAYFTLAMALLNGPPPQDDKGGHAGGFRGELQPARGGHRQTRDLAKDTGQTHMAQLLFEAEEHRPLVAGFGENHAIGMQPSAGERWREQVAGTEAPQHGAVDAGQHAGNDQRGSGSVDSAGPAAGHPVQRARSQPALR